LQKRCLSYKLGVILLIIKHKVKYTKAVKRCQGSFFRVSALVAWTG
jgi:hypothetical protein